MATGKTLECASCGRKDEKGPEGAKPIFSQEKWWCSYCAAIIQTGDQKQFVDHPSPGEMVSSSGGCALVAWQDCYSTQPKKRILVRDAKAEIQRAWKNWEGDKASNMSKLEFFFWLEKHRPYFLTFRGKGDLWQRVKGWILEYEDDLLDE